MESFKLLKEYMPLLGLCTSNGEYPVFCKHIYSDGDHVITCNNKSFAMIDLKLPFVGFVNYFILNNLLSKLSDKADISVSDNNILIEDGNFKSKLNIDIFEPPDYSDVLGRINDVSFIKISPAISDALYTGKMFTSKVILDTERVVIIPQGIIATTGKQAFFCANKINTVNAIRMSKELISIVDETVQVGSDGTNTIYRADGIICIFSLGVRQKDPATLARLFYNLDSVNSPILRFSDMQNAIKKLSPMAYNEKSFMANMAVTKNSIEFSYQSAVNGVTSVTYETQKQEDVPDFNILLDGNFIKNLKLDSDTMVCYNQEFYNDRFGIILTHPKYTCLLIGEQI